jgi:hypothetical protein
MGRLIAVAGTMFILGMLFAFSVMPALAQQVPEEVKPDVEEVPPKEAKADPCSPSYWQSYSEDYVDEALSALEEWF